MAETFEAYRTRVLSYLGDEEPRRAAQHAGDAIMKTPTRNLGDAFLADGAEAGLHIPEKAKRTSTDI